jgi:hypothetical protein
MRYTSLVAIVSLALTAPAVYAQAAVPLGTWNIEYERGRRVENDEVTPIMGKATITISKSADTVVAMLQTAPGADGKATPPARLIGNVTPAGVVFVQKQTVQINLNGDLSPRDITMTWTLTSSGDTMTGTLARDMPGAPIAMEPGPVKGTRVK